MLENNFYANNYDYVDLSFYDYNTSSMVFCINLSNGCNLKCDYCFNSNKDGKSIDLNTIKKYLDLCFNTYPNKEKYYVDLSEKLAGLKRDMLVECAENVMAKKLGLNEEEKQLVVEATNEIANAEVEIEEAAFDEEQERE